MLDIEVSVRQSEVHGIPKRNASGKEIIDSQMIVLGEEIVLSSVMLHIEVVVSASVDSAADDCIHGTVLLLVQPYYMCGNTVFVITLCFHYNVPLFALFDDILIKVGPI